MMSLDPNKFDDRRKLGDRAKDRGDFAGAIVEYRAALKIHEDPELRAKLAEASCKVDPYR